VHEQSKPDYRIREWGKLKIDQKPRWERECPDSIALAVCSNAVLVADKSQLLALDIDSGKPLWSQPLPGVPVPWGLAVDAAGRIIVSLEDGRVACFAGT
jgi:outer membrane protein assembly factor BamB